MHNESVAALLSQADLLQQQSQFTEAIAQYRRAIELNPRFSWSYHYLGEALASQEDWEGAIAAYRRAIELNPNSTYAYHQLGQALTHVGQWEEAIACYHQAIELDANFCECHNSLGQAFAQQGKLDEAIACYHTAREIDPDYDDTYINLTDTAIQQGRLDQAVQFIQTAQQLNPGNWKTHHKFGDILQQQHRQDEAITAYQKAIQLNPKSVVSYCKLGEVLTHKNQYQEAINAYKSALELDPKSGMILHHLGHVLSLQEKWNDAIAYYRQAIELSPDSAVVYLHWGEALTQQQQWEKAIAKYQKALEIDPNFELAHQKLGATFIDWGQEYEKQKQWSAAAEIYRKAIQLGLTLPKVYEKLGDALQNAGTLDLKEVYRYYQKSLELEPNNIELGQKALKIKPENLELLYLVGNALTTQNKSQQAVKLYQKIQQLETPDVQSNLKLGEAFVQADALEEGITCYQKALELDSKSAKAYHLLGEALQKQGKLEKAKTAYQKAIKFEPEFFGTYHNLGDLLRQQKEFDHAVEAYQKAVEINPEFYWSYHNLGDTYVQLGQLDEAITAYQKATEINPHFAWSYHNLGEVLVQQSRLLEAMTAFLKAGELEPGLSIDTDSIKNLLLKRKHKSVTEEIYRLWLSKNEPREADLHRMAETVDVFRDQPLISIILPVFNPPEQFLRDAIESVLNQVYPNWELCIADDASTLDYVQSILAEYSAKDSRIQVTYRTENGHISQASNSALELATGEFIALLDHDDVLTPDALYEVALLLNRHPEADMIYSDEDKINPDNQRRTPFFKPEWCPDSFLSRMYTCHLGVYRRQLVSQIGGFRVGYEGSQDYDLVLRLTEQTEQIFHIPKVLYSWRMHQASTAGVPSSKNYAYEAAEKALIEALERRGEKGKIVSNHQKLPGTYTIRYEITDFKRVSIIIPTRNLGKTLDQCLHSIFEKSTYPNYEVIVIDNGSDEAETLAIFEKWNNKEPDRFKCYPLDIPFNFSKINNYAVTKAQGDYLLFLNNDIEVVTSDWLEAMVEQAQRPSIGAVGALLLYPDDTVQHAGVVLGIGDVAGHSHKCLPASTVGYFNQLVTVNNYSAVTGACLMCRREIFEAVQGFDETLEVAFNDVDLCLKIRKKGYQNIYIPHAVLYHYESKSRGYEDNPEKIKRFEKEVALMKQKWGDLLQNDPCYSPNLTRVRQDYSMRV